MFGVGVARVAGGGRLEETVEQQGGFTALHVLEDGGADLAELLVQQATQTFDSVGPQSAPDQYIVLRLKQANSEPNLFGSLELARIMSWLTMSVVKGEGSLPA